MLDVFSGSASTPDNEQETTGEGEVCKKLLAGERRFSKLELKIAVSSG